jgi:hypothetical protein
LFVYYELLGSNIYATYIHLIYYKIVALQLVFCFIFYIRDFSILKIAHFHDMQPITFSHLLMSRQIARKKNISAKSRFQKISCVLILLLQFQGILEFISYRKKLKIYSFLISKNISCLRLFFIIFF